MSIERLKREVDLESDKLAEMNPVMEQLKKQIKEIEFQVVEAGGPAYKKQKEEVEQLDKRGKELERLITRMKTTI